MAADDPASARRLDPVAARAALRRLARAGGPPWLHGEIARRLGERLLPMRAEPSRIVDWWATAGAGAPVLKKLYPRAEQVPVEPAENASESDAVPRPRAWWRFARTAAPALTDAVANDAAIGGCQLVWANMVLHLVRDPPALFARWQAMLDVDGVVAFSCLGPATLSELRALYATCGWPAPTPGFIDMHDLGDMLVQAGFNGPVLDQETLTLRWRSAEALLTELRGLGGNTAPDRFGGLRTPAWRMRLLGALNERAAGDGSIALSVEVAYGHGFKAAPRPRLGEPVAVSLDAMRAMVRQPRAPR